MCASLGTLHVFFLVLSAVAVVSKPAHSEDDAALVQVAVVLDRGDASTTCPEFTLAKQAPPKCVASATAEATNATAVEITAPMTKAPNTVATGVKCAACPSMELLGCGEVPPGHSCSWNTKMHMCFSDNTFTATCPKDNAEPNKLPNITGRLPVVLCKACSAKTAADTDAREGFYTGNIKFGPNVLRGKVTEAVIIEYRVHWSIEGTSTVGPTVAVVPRIRRASTIEVFCECSDAYKAVLSGVKIPTGATGLMVLPVAKPGLVMPVGSFASINDLSPTTELHGVRITGRVELAVANPAQFAADSSVVKALGVGIAHAAHVSPDRVVVSLQAEMDLVQVHDDDELAEMGLVGMRERRAREGKPGRVFMSYAINLPAYEASQSDSALKAVSDPSSLGSLLAVEVGKLPNGAKYDMKVLAVQTPHAHPRSSAPMWNPLVFTLPAIIAMLMCGAQ